MTPPTWLGREPSGQPGSGVFPGARQRDEKPTGGVNARPGGQARAGACLDRVGARPQRAGQPFEQQESPGQQASPEQHESPQVHVSPQAHESPQPLQQVQSSPQVQAPPLQQPQQVQFSPQEQPVQQVQAEEAVTDGAPARAIEAAHSEAMRSIMDVLRFAL